MATEVVPPPPSPAEVGAQEPYIVLYKVVTAGDYHALRISGDGQAEYTNHSRVYAITTRKRGDLEPGQVAHLFALLTDKGFFDLEQEYQLQPPEGGELEIAVEDVYYWVGAFDGQRENAVLSHEYARPLELQEITQALLDAVLQLPDECAYGQEGDVFLLAVDYRIMPYLRREEGMPSLELDDQGVKEYPALEQALLHPCALVRVEDLAGSKVGQFFAPEIHMMEVMFSGRHFVVLLLTQA